MYRVKRVEKFFLRGLFASNGNTFQNISDSLLNFNRNQNPISSSDLPDVNVPTTSIHNLNRFAISSNNQSLIFVAADNGLYKTIDGGRTWVYLRLPVKSNNGTVPISTVSLGSGDTLVYAGAENTVYKSLNGGDSWQVQSIATGATIYYILVDPQLSQIAYVGLNGDHR